MIIHKQTLQIEDNQLIELPTGSKILTVQIQNGEPQIWYLFDGRVESKEHRTIKIVGTGHTFDIDPDEPYIGTFQLHDGGLVFHLFETIY